jgi:DNA-binding MarR family transcriptional regulator
MQNNHIDILIKMGLSLNEAKVYLALLRKKISQVGEIATLSGVPQKMIYYVLQKLMSKGMCSLVPGKVKKYKPTEPGIGIGNFIKKAQNQIDSSKNMLDQLEKQYEIGQNETSSMECIEIIQNTTNVAQRVLSLERLSTEEVLSFNKPPYAMMDRNIEELHGLKRGTRYRSIYQIEEAKTLISMSVMEMYQQSGEEVRIAKSLPMKMMIFDSRILMFAHEECLAQSENFTAVIIQRSSIINALKELFELYWSQSMTVEKFREEYKDSISPEKHIMSK